MPRKSRVVAFVSYALANKKLAERFMERFEGQVHNSRYYNYFFWKNWDVIVGEEWAEEIEEVLEKSDVGLLLISPAFLASQFVSEQDMLRLIGDRKKAVLPVLLHAVDSDDLAFKGLDDEWVFGHPKAYGECSESERVRFAYKLYRMIEARLDRLRIEAAKVSVEKPALVEEFDVFLCHNSSDKRIVRRLKDKLRRRGLRVWLDESELPPGRPFQAELEKAIPNMASVAVLFGADGRGPWQDMEMRAFLEEFVRRAIPVIPVLLPGAPKKPELPIFLRGFGWVDLRDGLSAGGLDRLEWGITGLKPANI